MTLMLSKSIRKLLFLAMACIGLATASWAVAAQEVIKQTGTTVFPIKITTPGNHVLTSNLVLTGRTVDAIDIKANDVTINLNGFSIIGPGAGSGVGINGASNANISVTNGTVTKMGSRGILLGDNAATASPPGTAPRSSIAAETKTTA
jgi:hypothetical protein